MKLKSWISAILVFSALAILFTGCEASVSTGGDTISGDELSAQVKDSLEKQVGAPLDSVACDEVKAEVGEKFTCDGTEPNGNKIVIDGKITKADPDNNTFSFSVEVVS